MKKYYKLRVDLADITLNDVLKTIKDAKRYAYVLETGKTGDNPHVQLYIETTVKNRAFRARLRLLGQGNKFYSLGDVEKDPIEYLSYLMKEGELIWYNFKQELIDEVNAHQARVVEEMKKKKEEAKTPVWKKIYTDYNASSGYAGPLGLYMFVTEWYLRKQQMVRKSTIQATVDTIEAYECLLSDKLAMWVRKQFYIPGMTAMRSEI